MICSSCNSSIIKSFWINRCFFDNSFVYWANIEIVDNNYLYALTKMPVVIPFSQIEINSLLCQDCFNIKDIIQ
jgi:hypothetical protein